jgi:hypothetical protein
MSAHGLKGSEEVDRFSAAGHRGEAVAKIFINFHLQGSGDTRYT